MLTRIIKRIGDEAGAHGFRSTCDRLSEPVVQMALAHAIGDDVEKAYRRGDLFEKRRQLMQDWANYCPGRGVS